MFDNIVKKSVSSFAHNEYLKNTTDLERKKISMKFQEEKKDPEKTLFFSFFGLHYIYLGQWKIFILFIFTLAGFGIWWIIDIFRSYNITKEINTKILLKIINNYRINAPSSSVINSKITPQKDTQIINTIDVKYCIECGAKIGTDKFCSICGTEQAVQSSVNSIGQNKCTVETKTVNNIFEKFDNDYTGKRSKYIHSKDNITESSLEIHKKTHLILANDEKPIIVLNPTTLILYGYTGIVITNKGIHFKTIKNSFFASLWPRKGEIGAIPWNDIDSVEIAEHDTCYGTAYIGHELRINDIILGYVRMGKGILLDEKCIKYLNTFFTALADANILKRAPKEFTWQ